MSPKRCAPYHRGTFQNSSGRSAGSWFLPTSAQELMWLPVKTWVTQGFSQKIIFHSDRFLPCFRGFCSYCFVFLSFYSLHELKIYSCDVLVIFSPAPGDFTNLFFSLAHIGSTVLKIRYYERPLVPIIKHLTC